MLLGESQVHLGHVIIKGNEFDERWIALQSGIVAFVVSCERIREPMPRSMWNGRRALTLFAVALIGVALTTFASLIAQRMTNAGMASEFDRLTERVLSETSRLANQPRYGLAGLRGVFAASEHVTRSEVRNYVDSCDLKVDFPGAIGFGVIERVRRDDLESFVERERADGASDFEVFGLASEGDQYFNQPDLYVIKHCFPQYQNWQAWGLDVGTESNRRQAIERAISTGEPAITGKISLVQDGKKQTGFLYYLPVYIGGKIPATRQARESKILCVVYAPMIIEEAMHTIRLSALNMLDFEIYDGSEVDSKNLLYDDGGHLRRVAGSQIAEYQHKRKYEKRSQIAVGGRDWTIVTGSLPLFEDTASSSLVTTTIISGTLLTLLCTAFTHYLLTGRARAMQIAREMTIDLRHSKAAEKRLADIARRTSNAVVITDPEGRVEWVNEGFERITGYSFEDMKGQRPGDVLQGPDTCRQTAARIGEAARRGESCKAELVNYSKAGRRYHIEIDMVPLHDESGRVTGLMAIESDITDRITQKEVILEAQRVAESASKAKSEFLANMSHEIRTPMTAILGYADLLDSECDGELSATHRQYIQTVRRNGEHLLALINDILDVARVEAGKLVLEPRECDLAELLDDVRQLMSERAASKDLGLRFESQADLPRRVIADSVRVKQILINLIGNAIKFTDSGFVQLETSYLGESGGMGTLVFDVRDTGIGIPHEALERIFGAFEQVGGETAKPIQGTGLGLHITKSLAEMMGGDIKVSSNPGEGSTFHVKIQVKPVHQSEVGSGEAEAVPEMMAERAVGAMPLRGVHICLVEDGLDNQRLISHHLKKAGARVSVFENGLQAFECIEAIRLQGDTESQADSFHLVLTDIQMPVMDGYQLATKLRENGWERPIVAITAYAMDGDAQRCISAGCDDYVSKPIQVQSMISTCVRVLQGRMMLSIQPDS